MKWGGWVPGGWVGCQSFCQWNVLGVTLAPTVLFFHGFTKGAVLTQGCKRQGHRKMATHSSVPTIGRGGSVSTRTEPPPAAAGARASSTSAAAVAEVRATGVPMAMRNTPVPPSTVPALAGPAQTRARRPLLAPPRPDPSPTNPTPTRTTPHQARRGAVHAQDRRTDTGPSIIQPHHGLPERARAQPSR